MKTNGRYEALIETDRKHERKEIIHVIHSDSRPVPR